MTHGITEAIEVLRQTPQEPVVAEIDGLVVELRYRGRRSADDIFEEVGAWEGETEEELRRMVLESRQDSDGVTGL